MSAGNFEDEILFSVGELSYPKIELKSFKGKIVILALDRSKFCDMENLKCFRLWFLEN